MHPALQLEARLVELVRAREPDKVLKILKNCTLRTRRIVLPNLVYHGMYYLNQGDVMKLAHLHVGVYGPVPVLSEPIVRSCNEWVSPYLTQEVYIQNALLGNFPEFRLSRPHSRCIPYDTLSSETWAHRVRIAHRKKRILIRRRCSVV